VQRHQLIRQSHGVRIETADGVAYLSFLSLCLVQLLNRLTFASSLSHLRRLNTPLGREGKQAKPRQLHNTHWGMVCPAETPEGHAVSPAVTQGLSPDGGRCPKPVVLGEVGGSDVALLSWCVLVGNVRALGGERVRRLCEAFGVVCVVARWPTGGAGEEPGAHGLHLQGKKPTTTPAETSSQLDDLVDHMEAVTPWTEVKSISTIICSSVSRP
jgi:hypothetical protein